MNLSDEQIDELIAVLQNAIEFYNWKQCEEVYQYSLKVDSQAEIAKRRQIVRNWFEEVIALGKKIQ